MSTTIMQETEKVLRQFDDKYFSDNNVNKALVIEDLSNYDTQLIKAMLLNEKIKKSFTTQIDNHAIFKVNEFIEIFQADEYWDDSYTKYSKKIGLATNRHFIDESNEVVLDFPYKDTYLKASMSKEDTDRENKEPFLNEIIAREEIDVMLDKKVLVNAKKYTPDHVEPATTSSFEDNLVIKGNNLLALHSLKEKYLGKIKLVYIDPPYNTGGSGDSFAYNNTFKHSTWLTFMKNRLEVAKELITEDGFIAMAIDHVELFYLGALADEIFGGENRVGIVTVIHKPEGRNQEKFFATSNEFMLVYAKDKSKANFSNVIFDEDKKKEYDQADEKGPYKLNNYLRSGGGDHNLRENKPHFFYPIFVHPDTLEISLEAQENYEKILPITNSGQERTWKTKKDTFNERLNDGEIVATKDNDGKITVNEKYRKGQLVKTHWIGTRYNSINSGTKVLEKIIGTSEFTYPKSLYTVQDIIDVCTTKDDIILDFFAGSGTTAHAVQNLNKEDNGTRKFIVVEQMDYIKTVLVPRTQKILNEENSFIYVELMDKNRNYIDEVQSASDQDTLNKVFNTMLNYADFDFRVDLEEVAATLSELSLADQKKTLVNIIDKNQLYYNFSEIDDKNVRALISDNDYEFNHVFYQEEIK